MRKLLTIGFVLLATTASARSPDPGTLESLRPHKVIHASQKQGQVQIQGQAQGQAQSASASNSGSVTVGGDNHKASAYAPSLGGFASGPCVGTGVQGTVGVVGFGAGVGVSSLDDSCTRRETARVLHMMGHADLALKVLMLDPLVQQAIKPAAAAAVPQTPAQVSSYCARNPADFYCKN